MDDRATWLARTMVELTDTLVDDFDMMVLFSTLVERCAELVGDAEVGLVLDDQRGNLRPVASSTERMGMLELFEIQSEDGPCQDAYRDGRRVANRVLDDRAGQDWPVFTPRARELGFRMVHAVPMRCRDQVVGAINVFQVVPRELAEEDVQLLQAMADTATIALLQNRAVARASELASQLQLALSTRIVIEQAKGVLAERQGIGVEEAFGRLRELAASHHERLEEVAAAVIRGESPD